MQKPEALEENSRKRWETKFLETVFLKYFFQNILLELQVRVLNLCVLYNGNDSNMFMDIFALDTETSVRFVNIWRLDFEQQLTGLGGWPLMTSGHYF